MSTFANIKELITALNREKNLLAELFKKRKSPSFKYEYALELADDDDNRIQYLLHHSIVRQNGNYLELDDTIREFFEQVLEVNEEINTSYINHNIELIKQAILYWFDERREPRRYEYLKTVKNTLRKLGTITLRNVVDLKRNIDTTFKNEPDYKIKKAKLEHLDRKRKDIALLIEQTEHVVTEEELTFFRAAADEELNRVVIQLKIQLSKCTHNLIDIEKQIIDFLNQIRYQSQVTEKLRLIKYLKDQFILETATDIKQVLSQSRSLVFEPRPSHPLKMSLVQLQTGEDAFDSIRKVNARAGFRQKSKRPLAGNIAGEYLETTVEEEMQVSLEEVKNGFMASSYHLFDFVMNYGFAKEISFEEKVTVYCQMISQYETGFNITGQYEEKNEIEFALVYPK